MQSQRRVQALLLTEIIESEEGAGNQEGAEEDAEEVHPLSLK